MNEWSVHLSPAWPRALCVTVVRVNWMLKWGEFSFTGDARSTNFKLVIWNYAALECICRLSHSCNFHCVLNVKLVTLDLFEKIWFPMYINFPEYWVPCWLQCLHPFLLNIYLWKYFILSRIVYFTYFFESIFKWFKISWILIQKKYNYIGHRPPSFPKYRHRLSKNQYRSSSTCVFWQYLLKR